MYEIIVPEKFIGRTIGKQGEHKKVLEEKFQIELDINSETGKVTVSGAEEGDINMFVVKNILAAMAYGHEFKHGLLLENDEFVHDIFDVKQYVQGKRIKSVMGRIIGLDGKTKKQLAELSQCHIAIYEYQVSSIGVYENIMLLKKALEMISDGSKASNVYAMLEYKVDRSRF